MDRQGFRSQERHTEYCFALGKVCDEEPVIFGTFPLDRRDLDSGTDRSMDGDRPCGTGLAKQNGLADLSTQVPRGDSDFIDEVYSGSSINKSSGDGYILNFDIHVNRRNGILGIGLRLNYGVQSANRFFLYFLLPFRLNSVGAIPRHVAGVDLATPVASIVFVQILAFRIRELGEGPWLALVDLVEADEDILMDERGADEREP